MRTDTFVSRLVVLALLLIAASAPAVAQDQTNDPLVDEQQYLFDVHNLDEAWSYTTGSSNVKIGVYSMLGFIQDHEDLSGSRVLVPQGNALFPSLDYASEMVGITGADTDNGVGMAGIDRAARFQSYSVLASAFDPDADAQEVFEFPDGREMQFHFNQSELADLIHAGRSSGVDVHLFSYGTPTTDPFEDFDIDSYAPDEGIDLANPPSLDPEDAPSWEGIVGQIFSFVGNYYIDYLSSLDFGSGDLDPLVAFNDAIGQAVAEGGVVVALTATSKTPPPARLLIYRLRKTVTSSPSAGWNTTTSSVWSAGRARGRHSTWT